MRQASAWVGSLVLVSAMACRGSAPPPAAAGVPGCIGTNCTIILEEVGDLCSVDPPTLVIESGYKVTFATQVSTRTEAVVITPKGPSPIVFQHGPPGRIDRGKKHDSGMTTGAAGDTYRYNARFVGPRNREVCPLIDPVICVKPGGVDPGGTIDTCD